MSDKEKFSLFSHDVDTSLKVLVPYDACNRPNTAGGSKVICPYENPMQSLLVFEKSIEVESREVKNEGYDFCWNSCDIENCPTYVKERGEQ